MISLDLSQPDLNRLECSDLEQLKYQFQVEANFKVETNVRPLNEQSEMDCHLVSATHVAGVFSVTVLGVTLKV